MHCFYREAKEEDEHLLPSNGAFAVKLRSGSDYLTPTKGKMFDVLLFLVRGYKMNSGPAK